MKPHLVLPPILLSLTTLSSAFATKYDYDGDGIADIAVRRPGTQYWYINNSGNNNFNSDREDGIQRHNFGKQDSDIPVVGDYDGDGITDIAVRRPSTFTWYVKNSSGDNTNSERADGIQRQIFGRNASDIPVPADYDGDGRTDFAVRRTSNYTWYVLNSSGSNFNSENEDGIQRIVFGKNESDVPVSGDFNGDGYDDFAIWRESNATFYVKNSDGSNFNSEREDGIQRIELGQSGDIPVTADYDGDGITDVAVRTPDTFTWNIIQSSDGQLITDVFGLNSEDIPVPADYDGDGKADLAVRRASTQYFYIKNSSGGNYNSDREDGIQRHIFGKQSEDIPTNAPITEVIAKLNAYLGNDSNSTPVANAGEDQTVSVGATVQLNGLQSSDPDSDELSYTWTITSSPTSSQATLSNSSATTPTFVADIAGEYNISLVVNDGTVDSDSDSTTITAQDMEPVNTVPVANAGNDQEVSVNNKVTLDGTASMDADGDSLTYNWELILQPSSSNVVLDGATTEAPSFTPDIAGEYTIELVVNDGKDSSESDSVKVTASNTNVNITDIEFSNRSGDCADYAGSYFSNVSDVQRNTDYTGDVTISAGSNSCSFSVNEIPNHDFNETGNFATNASEQSGNYEVDRNPSIQSANTAMSLRTTNAITLNGVVIDLLAAACYGIGDEPLGEEKIGCNDDQINNPWRYDPMSSLNRFGTDEHNAHTQPDGTYHYHGDPVAMYAQDCESIQEASPVVGFAADGFPIYGPCFSDNGSVRKAQSSFVLKQGTRQTVDGYDTPVEGQGVVASNQYDGQFIGDWEYSAGNGDLDECNGMTIDGQYGYYITDSYPWILSCYKATPNSSFNKGGNALINLMHRHEPHHHKNARSYPHKH